MRFAGHDYVDYSPEEVKKIDECKNVVTYNDLRMFLKQDKNGFELHDNYFNYLDEDLFKGNPVIYVENVKKIEAVQIGLDLLGGIDKALKEQLEKVDTPYQFHDIAYDMQCTVDDYKKANHEECIALAKLFLKEMGISEKEVIRTMNPNSLFNRLFAKLREKKINELKGLIELNYLYCCGVTPDRIVIVNNDSNDIVAEITTSWAKFVAEKKEEKNLATNK